MNEAREDAIKSAYQSFRPTAGYEDLVKHLKQREQDLIYEAKNSKDPQAAVILLQQSAIPEQILAYIDSRSS